MTKPLTENDIRRKLLLATIREGSQRQWGEKLGYTQSFVSEMVSGRKPITDKAAEALGYERRFLFIEKRKLSPGR